MPNWPAITSAIMYFKDACRLLRVVVCMCFAGHLKAATLWWGCCWCDHSVFKRRVRQWHWRSCCVRHTCMHAQQPAGRPAPLASLYAITSGASCTQNLHAAPRRMRARAAKPQPPSLQQHMMEREWCKACAPSSVSGAVVPSAAPPSLHPKPHRNCACYAVAGRSAPLHVLLRPMSVIDLG